MSFECVRPIGCHYGLSRLFPLTPPSPFGEGELCGSHEVSAAATTRPPNRISERARHSCSLSPRERVRVRGNDRFNNGWDAKKLDIPTSRLTKHWRCLVRSGLCSILPSLRRGAPVVRSVDLRGGTGNPVPFDDTSLSSPQTSVHAPWR